MYAIYVPNHRYWIMNDNGGIRMAWLTIVIGIVIGYMIYQKKQQSAQSEYDQDPNETASCSDTVRSMQNNLRPETGSADAKREINEAVVAGERALKSLRAAKSKLDSARAWGIYDMLGGGFLSSVMKHGQIGKANEWMEQANADLRHFAKELQDVPGEYLHIQTGDLISMLDVFCDNFFSDIMIQSRINDARSRLDQVINRVQETVWTLASKK